MATTTVEVVDELFVGSVLYGIYLPTLFCCLRCLIWDDYRSRIKSLKEMHWLTLISASTLFVCSTLSVSLGMLRSRQALIQCTEPSAFTKDYSQVSNWVDVTKGMVNYVVIFVGDGILIYRCWIVWGKNYFVIALPAILWLVDFGCGVAITCVAPTVQADSVVAATKLKPLFLAYTGLTIPVNVISTSLIVYRIWRVDRETAKTYTSTRKSSSLQKLIRIFVESGSLYTASALLTFLTYVINSDFFYVGAAFGLHTTGIAFNLIITRAHKQAPDEYTLPHIHSLHFQQNHELTTQSTRVKEQEYTSDSQLQFATCQGPT